MAIINIVLVERDRIAHEQGQNVFSVVFSSKILDEEIVINIYNSFGIPMIEPINSTGKEVQIQTDHFCSGFYYVFVFINGNRKSYKLIISK